MNLHSLFATLFLLLPSVAQDEVKPPAAKAAAPGVTVTLSFSGGPLADFVAQIRQKEPRVNIVMADGAANAMLPQMELRGAGIDQALESACAVATSDQTIRVKDYRGTGEPVYTIVAVSPPRTPVTDREHTRTEVHGLMRLTADNPQNVTIAATTVLSAVEAAIGEPKLATLRLHRESGLMIVRGTGEQLEVVDKVLMSLERDLADRRARLQQRDEARPTGADVAPSDDRKEPPADTKGRQSR
jgi:hypothetical protein